MSQFPEPAEQLKDTPLRFLESEQFQEMLDTYNKLKPLEKEHPRKFKNQMNVFDFGDIYPLMDTRSVFAGGGGRGGVHRRVGDRHVRRHAAGYF